MQGLVESIVQKGIQLTPAELEIADPQHHYSDVIMSVMASQLFTQPFVHVQIKATIKARSHWLLWGKFTGEGVNSPH